MNTPLKVGNTSWIFVNTGFSFVSKFVHAEQSRCCSGPMYSPVQVHVSSAAASSRLDAHPRVPSAAEPQLPVADQWTSMYHIAYCLPKLTTNLTWIHMNCNGAYITKVFIWRMRYKIKTWCNLLLFIIVRQFLDWGPISTLKWFLIDPSYCTCLTCVEQHLPRWSHNI